MRKLMLVLAFFGFTVAYAQKTKAPAPQSTADNDSAFFSKVKYRLVGPWRGGRSGAVTGSYKNKNTFYFGSTGGGVWKTTLMAEATGRTSPINILAAASVR
jgi:hypothetical protein